ncbi:MAG: hypothetical protein OXU23_00925 [Candidatus Poribacteria bacterium]|nr:hypothetical protein [Candidatus Poribacteria bacterium]
MIRDFWTNKWVLGGVGFLIVLSIACVLWYQHDIAPEKKAAAEAEEMLRQSQIAKKVADTDTEAVKASDVLVESNTLTAEKPITEAAAEVVKDTDPDKTSVNMAQVIQEKDSTEEVRISPYGFGPYPDLPPGFPEDYWDKRSGNKDNELLARVRIKLVEQGKNVTGAGMLNGLVYPTIPGTIYVEWRWDEVEKERYVGLMMGDPFVINSIRGDSLDQRFREKDIPIGIEVINYLNGGIDPYQFLGLKE